MPECTPATGAGLGGVSAGREVPERAVLLEGSQHCWLWHEALSGREDYSFELWSILRLKAWLREVRANG